MVSESSDIKRASTAESLVISASEGNQPPPPAKDVESKPVEAKEPLKISIEEAKVAAAEIEQALNDNSQQTVVKFSVSLVEDNEEHKSLNGFKFQVVDRETGKVVRQFPPEDIMNMKERVKANPPTPGVLIDSQA